MNIFNINRNKGFTLIEIMVASSIFMVVMLVVMGALVSVSYAAKEAQALRTAMDNVNFAMESMTRSLRTGTNYTCVSPGGTTMGGSQNIDCIDGGGAIIFTSQDGSVRDTAYKLEDGTVKKCTNIATNCLSIVSPNVNVNRLVFYVKGSAPGDLVQPSVYILMRGSVKVKNVDHPFALQTFVSQRSWE